MPKFRSWSSLLVPCALVGLSVASCTERKPSPPPQPPAVEFVDAPAGAVASLVSAEIERTPPNQIVLVYVSASWCEPCVRFQQAAAAGELVGKLDGLRLVKFDLDVDEQRLVDAGYDVDMIPLFAVPRLDGTSSDRFIAGSVKGGGAVDNIVPRLQALVTSGTL